MAEWVDLLDSENQKYDNTTSGLTATNAKDAIDELAASPGTGDVVGPAGGTVDDEFALYDDTTGKLIRGASGTTLSATVAAINGKIDGPASATNREIVAFDGTSGKIGDGAGYTQTQVITQNQSDQYLATGNKATPVSADRILIEDSAATFGKKYVDVGDLPTGVADLTNAVFPTYAVFDEEYDNGNAGASITIDFTNGNKHVVTLTANTAITLSGVATRSAHYQVKVVQDATGGRTPTIVNAYKKVRGTSLDWNTDSGGESMLNIYFDGTGYYIQQTPWETA